MSTYLRQALSLTDQCEGFEKHLYPSQQACNIVACLIGYGKSRPHLAFDLTKKVDIHSKVVIFSHLISHYVYKKSQPSNSSILALYK